MLNKYFLISCCFILSFNSSCTNDIDEGVKDETQSMESLKLVRVDKYFNNNDIGDYIDFTYDDSSNLTSIYENFNFMPFTFFERIDSNLTAIWYAQNPMLSTFSEEYIINYEGDAIILKRGTKRIEIETSDGYIDSHRSSYAGTVTDTKFVRDDNDNIVSIQVYYMPEDSDMHLIQEYFFSDYAEEIHPKYLLNTIIDNAPYVYEEFLFLLDLKITKQVPKKLTRFTLNNLTEEMDEEMHSINILSSEDNLIRSYEPLPIYNSDGNFSYDLLYE